jgi:hypothetical protein
LDASGGKKVPGSIYGTSAPPKDAASWNSDYLLPDESFSVRFERVGVDDYFCRPHEHAEGSPKAVVGAFPGIADTLRKGRISPHGGWAPANLISGDKGAAAVA